MIAVVAPAGELRDALLGRLPADTRVVAPGDPMALASALQGVERMLLAVDDPVAAADAVAAAEMALVYRCVSLHPVDALSGSAMRSAVVPGDDLEAAVRELLRDDAGPA